MYSEKECIFKKYYIRFLIVPQRTVELSIKIIYQCNIVVSSKVTNDGDKATINNV